MPRAEHHHPERRRRLVDGDRVAGVERAEQPRLPRLRAGLHRGGVEVVGVARRRQVPQVEQRRAGQQREQRRALPARSGAGRRCGWPVTAGGRWAGQGRGVPRVLPRSGFPITMCPAATATLCRRCAPSCAEERRGRAPRGKPGLGTREIVSSCRRPRTPRRTYRLAAMTTPMAATTTCTSSSSQSMPGVFVEMPSAPASQVPMNAATIPTTIVSQIGIGWRPGTTSRPSAPMIAPMMIAVMMPVTVIVPPSALGPPVHGPYGRWMPEASETMHRWAVRHHRDLFVLCRRLHTGRTLTG